MHLLNKISNIYLLLLAVMIVACAQVRSLPGGTKDISPPNLTATYPANEKTRFDDNAFSFEFDEYIQVNNINQELIVSPPLQKAPTIKVKKKNVFISWKEELIPNTTYQFNFGDGITDVNEGNKATDLIYVFSTGDKIDSLMIHGIVRDVYNDVPGKGFKVMLFENDSAVFADKPRPSYFTRSKDDGSFTIAYLKEGTYSLVAVEDLNSNYGWNEGEAIAIEPKSIVVSGSDSALAMLHASVPYPKELIVDQYITDSVGSVKFAAPEHFTDVRVRSIDGREVYQYRTSDSLIAHLAGLPSNEMEVLEVSSGYELRDTIRVPFYTSSQSRNFRLSLVGKTKLMPGDTVILSARCLLTNDDSSKLALTKDSLPVKFNLKPLSIPGQYSISGNWIPGGQYEFLALPGAFHNQSGGTNDTLKVGFSIYKPDELGTLDFTLDTEFDKSLAYFELRDKNAVRVFFSDNLSSGKIFIAALPAGEYNARIVRDLNRNGRYDPAIPNESLPPEITHVYSGKINVRANWELKLNWKIENQN